MKTITGMLKSKRFISFLIEVILFALGVFFFHADPEKFALGLGIVFAPYQAVQSFRSSTGSLTESDKTN